MKLIHCITALLLCGCAESVTTGTSQLSVGLINRDLVNGKTTKARVRAMLGEPQSSSISEIGGNFAEVWVYQKSFYRDPAEKGFGYGVLFNMATGSQYDRVETAILMVTFDRNGIVKGHTFSQAATGMPR